MGPEVVNQEQKNTAGGVVEQRGPRAKPDNPWHQPGQILDAETRSQGQE